MRTRRGFTLVELLVVIVIIGILAAIITVAVAAAFRASHRAKIGMEAGQIAMAIDRYHAEFGEYPPDFYDDDALVRHVRKRWPRYELPQGANNYVIATHLRLAMALVYRNSAIYPQNVMSEWVAAPNAANLQLTTPDTNISSLAIWLGGFANPEGRFEGFSADPEAPFGRDGNGVINSGSNANGLNMNDVRIGTPDKKVFMELEVNKNVFFFDSRAPNGRAGLALCLGTKSGSMILPIVYFRGNSSGGPGAYYDFSGPQPQIKSYNFGINVAATGNAPGSVWNDCGVVVPYAKSGTYNANLPDSTIVWNNPTTYQLIHPGLDGKFSNVPPPPPPPPPPLPLWRVINSGIGIGVQDLDNITNFSDNKELRSILP